MLTKIHFIRRVGLFDDAIPHSAPPVDMGNVTIMYAENGRGKSTLSSIFRALALNDSDRINARKTIDATVNPEVKIEFDHLGSSQEAFFSSTGWSSSYPDIIVFDSEFVDENVYSGLEVGSDQKKSIIEFIMGDSAVSIQDQLSQVNDESKANRDETKLIEQKLFGFRGNLSIQEFIGLQEDSNVDVKLLNIRNEINSAQSNAKIQSLHNLEKLSLLSVNLDDLFLLLRKQISDMEKDAELQVRRHLEQFSASNIEGWVSEGTNLMQDDCPYCGQTLTGLNLIEAYKTFFSNEYRVHKNDIDKLFRNTMYQLAIDTKLNNVIKINSERLQTWEDKLSLKSDDELTWDTNIVSKIELLRSLLKNLIVQKQSNPLEKVGDATHEKKAINLLTHINQQISDYNETIRHINLLISKYKASIDTAHIDELEAKQTHLETVKARHSVEVVEIIQDRASLEVKQSTLTSRKNTLKQQLTNLLKTTFEPYQQRVNELIKGFGGSFEIEKLSSDYRAGGNARGTYGLRIRDNSLALGKRVDVRKKLTFATVLSEADKRTLAFAFFIARVEQDPNVSDKVIVLDDPVSSLDSGRRKKTIKIVQELAETCKQVIVFSHDAYFVRSLRNHLVDRRTGQKFDPKIHEIRHTVNNYSTFDICDIDKVCASPYYRRYSIVSEYLDGAYTDEQITAEAIRSLLEVYVHRKFPMHIAKGKMFGQTISQINDASSPSPLIHLKSIVTELRDINEYACQFHHDTNPDYNPMDAVINRVELRGYCQRTLDVIHQN